MRKLIYTLTFSKGTVVLCTQSLTTGLDPVVECKIVMRAVGSRCIQKPQSVCVHLFARLFQVLSV
jgi:hypothetical protein